MSARTIVITVLVSALCAGLYLVRDSSAPDVRDHSAATGETPDVANGRDAEVVRDNEQSITTLSSDLSASSDSSGASRAPDDPPPVLLPHQVVRTPMTESLEDLHFPLIPELLETERLFAAERVDPFWADATEGRILGEIARTTGLQLVTLHVECRTSMCRLQLVEREGQGAEPSIVFPSTGAGRPAGNGRVASFTDLVSRLDLDARWVASIVDRNGTPQSLAYLARSDVADSSTGVPR